MGYTVSPAEFTHTNPRRPILNFLKNIPTEIFENEMPEILIHHYGLREDSGGAGQFRGGTGIEIEFETSVPYTVITSRSMERYIFPPPGRMGGGPGATGYTLYNPGTDDERDIGKIDLLEMNPGERLRIGTQGGGGFGDPLERPAAQVAEDIANRVVYAQTARQLYGVILTSDGAVDEPATEQCRNTIRRKRGWTEPPAFGFGPAREAYMARWTDELEDAMWLAVADLPVQLMQFLYQRLHDAIESRLNAGERVTGEDVPTLFTSEQQALMHPHAARN